MEEYIIELLNPIHYDMGFLETLSTLRKVELDREAFGHLLNRRMQRYMLDYVLIFDQKIASIASVYIEHKFYGKVARITDVTTGENYRHQGFGTKLVQYCLDVAQQRGCYKATLNCNDKNVEWYRSIGFYRHENQMRKDFGFIAKIVMLLSDDKYTY